MVWLSSLLLFVAFSASVKPSASLAADTRARGDACNNFTIGNPAKREFYSPNYPNAYPLNIKCTRRIVADPGHVVMLEFRDRFELETSATCSFDKLEVRDGAYGYSRLLGTFCGSDIPSPLVSTGRYMWLQFSSDLSVAGKGFKAEYKFIDKPKQDEE